MCSILNYFFRLQATAESKLADFKDMSATGLQYAIQQQSVMDLNVDLRAPYIIVPHGGFYSGYVRCCSPVSVVTGRCESHHLLRRVSDSIWYSLFVIVISIRRCSHRSIILNLLRTRTS